MEEDRNVVVKITMPKHVADAFSEESTKYFGDARWLNMMFKDKMYQALYLQQEPEMKEKLNLIRLELIELVRETQRNNLKYMKELQEKGEWR